MRVPESSTIAGFNHVSGTVDETHNAAPAEGETVDSKTNGLVRSSVPFKLFDVVSDERPSPQQGAFGLSLLMGLGSRVNNRGTAQHIYGGTVPAATIAKRRASNRVARKSRRANRR